MMELGFVSDFRLREEKDTACDTLTLFGAKTGFGVNRNIQRQISPT